MKEQGRTSGEQNGEAVNVEVLGVVVLIQTQEGGQIRFRQAPLDPRQARKLFNYLKHNVCGGTLVLSKQAMNCKPTEEAQSATAATEPEERRIIMP